MKDFIILTDSGCDLCQNKRKELSVEYLKMRLNLDNEEIYSSLDSDFDIKNFYAQMREGKLFKTTQVSLASYIDTFENYASKNIDVLYIACSSGLSGSYNTSCLAKKEVLAKYKKAKIICVDSLISSLGLGLIVTIASHFKQEGKSIDEIANWIEANKLKINQTATVDDLKYLKRAGRVTGAAAMMSSLLHIKPIIISNTAGNNETISKVMGRKKSLVTIIEQVSERIVNPTKQIIYISHADCIEDAEFLKEHLIKTTKCKDVYIDYVGPVIGASTGPGMIAVYYYGQEVD